MKHKAAADPRAWFTAIGLALAVAGANGCEPTTSTPPRTEGPVTVRAAVVPSCPAVAPARTLTPVWADGDLAFQELVGATVRFRVDGTYYEVQLRSFPIGTTFTLGSLTVEADDGGRIDVGDVIAAARPILFSDSDFKIDPHVDFEVRVPGFVPFRLPAPAEDARHHIGDAIAGAVNHPVLLGHETPSDAHPAQHTILYAGHGHSDAEVFGPAATIRDADWVAVSETLLPRAGATCTLKADTPTAPPTKVKVRLIDEEVLVVERRTSRVVARKTFPATTACPSHSSDGAVDNSPEPGAVTRWLREVRAGS